MQDGEAPPAFSPIAPEVSCDEIKKIHVCRLQPTDGPEPERIQINDKEWFPHMTWEDVSRRTGSGKIEVTFFGVQKNGKPKFLTKLSKNLEDPERDRELAEEKARGAAVGQTSHIVIDRPGQAPFIIPGGMTGRELREYIMEDKTNEYLRAEKDKLDNELRDLRREAAARAAPPPPPTHDPLQGVAAVIGAMSGHGASRGSAELADMHRQMVDQLREQVNNLNRQITDQQTQYNRQILGASETHNREMAEMRAREGNALADMRAQLQAAYTARDQAVMQAEGRSNAAAVANQGALNEMRKQWIDDVNRIQSAHTAEMARVNTGAEEKVRQAHAAADEKVRQAHAAANSAVAAARVDVNNAERLYSEAKAETISLMQKGVNVSDTKEVVSAVSGLAKDVLGAYGASKNAPPQDELKKAVAVIKDLGPVIAMARQLGPMLPKINRMAAKMDKVDAMIDRFNSGGEEPADTGVPAPVRVPDRVAPEPAAADERTDVPAETAAMDTPDAVDAVPEPEPAPAETTLDLPVAADAE